VGKKDYYNEGSWNVICDECGFKFKSHELRKRWDGFMVDKACWEPRHPQDFVKGVVDEQSVPWERSENTELSISPFDYVADQYVENPGVPYPGTEYVTINGQ